MRAATHFTILCACTSAENPYMVCMFHFTRWMKSGHVQLNAAIVLNLISVNWISHMSKLLKYIDRPIQWDVSNLRCSDVFRPSMGWNEGEGEGEGGRDECSLIRWFVGSQMRSPNRDYLIWTRFPNCQGDLSIDHMYLIHKNLHPHFWAVGATIMMLALIIYFCLTTST